MDAGSGFAFPALERARTELRDRVAKSVIAVAGIHHSHHFGQAGYPVERLAEQGLVALMVGNSPQAIAPWGGSRGIFGTHPIAFAAPRREAPHPVDRTSVASGKSVSERVNLGGRR